LPLGGVNYNYLPTGKQACFFLAHAPLLQPLWGKGVASRRERRKLIHSLLLAYSFV